MKYITTWKDSIDRIQKKYEEKSISNGGRALFNSTMISRATLIEQQDDYKCLSPSFYKRKYGSKPRNTFDNDKKSLFNIPKLNIVEHDSYS